MNRQGFIGGGQTKFNVAEIVRLYESGMSQAEVGASVGCDQANISYLLRTRGIAARKAAKRNQKGAANSNWSGKAISYKGAHNRVAAMRGKPSICEVCGADSLSKRYEWANLTGNHYDPYDYKRMCRSCHCKHDNLIRNLGQYAGVGRRRAA